MELVTLNDEFTAKYKELTQAGEWFRVIITCQCRECKRLVYHGRYVWVEGDNHYCFSCGSKRQDEQRRAGVANG